MKLTLRIASFFVFPLVVFSIHLIISPILNLITRFPHLDIPLHYFGGLSIAYTAAQILSYLEQQKMIAPLNRVLILVLLLSITATAAVFWEFGEFLGDTVLHTNMQVSLANTMQDQFLGILGGMTWAFIHYKKTRPRPETLSLPRENRGSPG